MRYVECIEEIKVYIQDHISEKITVRTLAERSGYSMYHFCHFFVNVTGLSVGAYIQKFRLEMAAKDVAELHANIRKTWKYVYTEWLDSNGEWKYDQTKINFEYYCGEQICIYVPVCKA